MDTDNERGQWERKLPGRNKRHSLCARQCLALKARQGNLLYINFACCLSCGVVEGLWSSNTFWEVLPDNLRVIRLDMEVGDRWLLSRPKLYGDDLTLGLTNSKSP